MATLTLKPQHEDSVIGQILSLKSQLNYHKHSIAPFTYEMEKWEIKEYEAINSDNYYKLEELKQYIISNEACFNELLSSYNMSVAIFVNKYILN